jgi:hypothetical protein
LPDHPLTKGLEQEILIYNNFSQADENFSQADENFSQADENFSQARKMDIAVSALAKLNDSIEDLN